MVILGEKMSICHIWDINKMGGFRQNIVSKMVMIRSIAHTPLTMWQWHSFHQEVRSMFPPLESRQSYGQSDAVRHPRPKTWPSFPRVAHAASLRTQPCAVRKLQSHGEATSEPLNDRTNHHTCKWRSVWDVFSIGHCLAAATWETLSKNRPAEPSYPSEPWEVVIKRWYCCRLLHF